MQGSLILDKMLSKSLLHRSLYIIEILDLSIHKKELKKGK